MTSRETSIAEAISNLGDRGKAPVPASSAGLELTLETAVQEVNLWLELVLKANSGLVHA